MTVRRADLEGLLAALTKDVAHPEHGLFGPGSMTWKVNREVAPILGGGRAALLQLAHPYVAHAIEHHSPTKSDPSGRFVRTFTHVFNMLFGDLPDAVDTARRVHKVHARIRGPITEPTAGYAAGHRYEANDVDALIWVFATLVDTSAQCYLLLVGRLSDAELAQFYEESKIFAALFGIPAEALPANWAAFQRYMHTMVNSDTIQVTRYAREMADFLLDPPLLAYKPAMAAVRSFTAGLLPAKVRDQYELPSGVGQDLAFSMSTRLLRGTITNLPPRLRYFPAYVDAKRRLAGKGPDRVGKLLEELVVRSLPVAS